PAPSGRRRCRARPPTWRAHRDVTSSAAPGTWSTGNPPSLNHVVPHALAPRRPQPGARSGQHPLARARGSEIDAHGSVVAELPYMRRHGELHTGVVVRNEDGFRETRTQFQDVIGGVDPGQ